MMNVDVFFGNNGLI